MRNFAEANIHGSPNDFFDWMKVLGYEYEVIDKKLIFRSRDEFFKKDVTALSLQESEMADLVIEADNTHAYTSIEIGYDKQDYDKDYGRSEANGTFAYTTGYITSDDNKLSLISPYRGDSMGIEVLCQERASQTKDDKSDNDIFFMALVQDGDVYREYTDVYIHDNNTGVRLFNAPFNPYFLMRYNSSLWGVITDKVRFASTDMNREAEISMGEAAARSTVIDMYSDQQTDGKLFEPVIYNFAAGHWQELPPENIRNGLVRFVWHGEQLQGFIKRISKNYGAETETTWDLHMVK